MEPEPCVPQRGKEEPAWEGLPQVPPTSPTALRSWQNPEERQGAGNKGTRVLFVKSMRKGPGWEGQGSPVEAREKRVGYGSLSQSRDGRWQLF